MPAHRRPTRTGRRLTLIGAAVVVLAGAATTTMVLGDGVTADASDVPTPARQSSVGAPVPTIDTPAVVTAAGERIAAAEPVDAFAQIMEMAGFPTDADTATFMDTSVTAICRDLAIGRTGVDILAETADRTRARGWTDEQSDGLVYIGVASECSAYSYLLP